MKRLHSVYEYEFRKDIPYQQLRSFKARPTVKIIIENDKGEIACVSNKMNDFIQLPGGGIEKGESLREAARREAKEEAGSLIKNLHLAYYLEDFRFRNKKKYKNFCFTSLLKEDLGRLFLTDKEKKQGMRLHWIHKNKLLDIFSAQKKLVELQDVGFYHTSFNMIRDFYFMKEYLA